MNIQITTDAETAERITDALKNAIVEAETNPDRDMSHAKTMIELLLAVGQADIVEKDRQK